jgi:hypothetical protein
VRPQRDPAFIRLSDSDQNVALRLGAILRLAVALAEHGVANLTVAHTNGSVALTLATENDNVLEEVAARGDLWRERIGPITLRPARNTTHFLRCRLSRSIRRMPHSF